MRKADIIIFGCGGVGEKVKNLYERQEQHIIAFSDNDSSRWGKEYLGYRIIPPSEIANTEFDYVAIGIYKAASMIKEQLIAYGVDFKKIVIPIEPPRIFYNDKVIWAGDIDKISDEEYISVATQEYIGNNIVIADDEFKRKIERLKKVLHDNNIPRSKVCIVSGAVLQAYNLRESKRFDDIDIIMTSDLRELYGKELVIVSEIAEMHPQNQYDISDDEIIMNVNNHFCWKDIKFMRLELLYRNISSKNFDEQLVISHFFDKINMQRNKY